MIGLGFPPVLMEVDTKFCDIFGKCNLEKSKLSVSGY